MGIPIKYRRSTEPAIATYNYADIAEGTGTTLFYGCVASNSAGSSYAILTDAVYSDVIETTVDNNNTTLRFDSGVFNSPRTIKGTAFFSGHITNAAGGTATLQVQLFKLAGGSETAISSNITSATYTNATDKKVLIKLPLTQTGIKKGEQIRLTIIMTRAGAGTFNLGHDPKDRTGPASGMNLTQLVLYCPFRIDL